MARILFFRMALRICMENTNNKLSFSRYNIFHRSKYFFFRSVFWSLFNYRQKSQSDQEQCSLCYSSRCFRSLRAVAMLVNSFTFTNVIPLEYIEDRKWLLQWGKNMASEVPSHRSAKITRTWGLLIAVCGDFSLSPVVFVTFLSSLLSLSSSDLDWTLTSSFCNFSRSRSNSSKPTCMGKVVYCFPYFHLTPLGGVINLRSSFKFFGIYFFLS